MDDGIEEGGEFVDDEVIVLHELLSVHLAEESAVDVMLAGAEGGQEGRALSDNDYSIFVQPGALIKEVVGVPLEHDPLRAAELLQHEGAATKGDLAEAGVLIYHLGGHDSPGGVGHVLEGRDEGAVQDDVESVRVRRLQAAASMQEALRVALVRSGEGRAAAEEALFAVQRGELIVSGGTTVRRRPDFDTLAEGKVEVGSVRQLHLSDEVVQDRFLSAGPPGVEVRVHQVDDAEAGEVDVGVDAAGFEEAALGDAATRDRAPDWYGAAAAGGGLGAVAAAIAVATDHGGAGDADNGHDTGAQESPPGDTPAPETVPVFGLSHTVMPPR